MDIKEQLRHMLTEKRYIHSLGVADTAEKLANRCGVDPQKAYTAGLVHDAAKNLSLEESVEACHRLGVSLDEIELANPALIHASLGAEYIEEQFGIADREIKDAVRYHTTGRAGMGMLEKIIYLADMIEPNRCFDGVDKLRALAENDINDACIEAGMMTVRHTMDNRQLVHPNTIFAVNDLLLKKRMDKTKDL